MAETTSNTAAIPTLKSPLHFHMNHTLKFFLIILVIGIVGGFVGYYLSNLQQPREIQQATVIGTANLEVDADTLTVAASLETKGKGYASTSQANKSKLDAVKDALTAAGLPEDKIVATSAYTVEDYNYDDNLIPTPVPSFFCGGSDVCPSDGGGGGIGRATPQAPQKLAATLAATDSLMDDKDGNYVSTITFSVTIDGQYLAEEEKLVAVITKYDANPTLTYSLKKKEDAYTKVQELAVLNARKQAENVAKINKAHVKKVLSIKSNKKLEDASYNLDPADYSVTKKIALTESYEVRYELEPNFLSF